MTLNCFLPDALPSPNVSWLKDGVPLEMRYDGRVKVIKQDNFSQVVIRQAWTSDSGNYSCQVSNPVETRSDEVKLNVYGKYKKYITIQRCTCACSRNLYTASQTLSLKFGSAEVHCTLYSGGLQVTCSNC